MRIAVVCVAFLLSGVSALLFETLWLRLCGISFGNATVSAAVTLSSFMAGLGLGGAAASAVRKTKTRLLVTYGRLELVIGLTGLLVVFVIPSIGEITRPLITHLGTGGLVINTCRFAFSFGLLLVPAAAMGLTLPVIVADPLFQQRDFRRAISLLYGCNTLGAVIGALLGEAFLLRLAGILGTAALSALLNAAVAVIAFAIARGERTYAAAEIQSIPPAWGSAKLIPLLAISFGCGAGLVALEVVWFRFLRLYIASSETAFAVMLSVVLAGIGLGSLMSLLRRRQNSVEQRISLSLLLLLAGTVTLLSYVFFPISALQRVGESWRDFGFDTWPEITLLAVVLMLPTACVSGMLFPAVVAAIGSVTARRLNSTGLAALFNTIGAALGPLLVTFALLPAIGFEKTLIVCASGYAILSLLAYIGERNSISKLGRSITATFATAFITLLLFFPYGRAEQHFAHAREPFEADGSHLIAKREGNADTWQLLQRDLLGQPYYYRLIANAFSMSSTQHPNQRYMRLFAYLPLTFRADAQNALLICFGCGVTADALLQDRQLHHVDIVDLAKEVFELADYFPGPNPLRDPRVTKYVEDGRFFLQATRHKYDVITGEPPPPKVAGSVNIYTEEFFRSMNAALNEGGIATFWLPIYQLRVEETKAILRAFHDAFPNASVWASSDDEWIMMGIKGSTSPLGRQQIERLWEMPETREGLNRIGLENPAQLGALFVMDASEIERVTSNIAPLCDMYPKRLTDAPVNRDDVHAFSLPYMDDVSAARRFRSSPLIAQLIPEDLRAVVDRFFEVRAIRYRSLVSGSNKLAELDFYLRRSSLRMPVLEVLGSDEDRIAIAKRVTSTIASAPNEALPDLFADALASRNFDRAISALEEERSRKVATRNDLLVLLYLNCLGEHVERAESLASSDAQVIGRDWFVHWLYGKLQAEYGFRPPH